MHDDRFEDDCCDDDRCDDDRCEEPGDARGAGPDQARGDAPARPRAGDRSADVRDLRTERLLLRSLDDAFLTASAEDAPLDALGARLGADVPPAWRGERAVALRYRDRLREIPGFGPWSLRAILLPRPGDRPLMVGHCCFHTPPGPAYLAPWAPDGVEIGYTVFPEHRRRGYAREAARGLVRWAATEHGCRTFVASVAVANTPSRSLLEGLGFRVTGQWEDETDGPEHVLVLRLPVPGE